MPLFKSLLSYMALFIFLCGCQSTPSPTSKYPLDLMWVRQSVEFEAICIQTYRAAWKSVKSRAASEQQDWAVVLDVDETTLDNSGYQEILFEQNREFPYYWDDWVRKEVCPAIPGVKAFLDSVHSSGKFAHVVYITNRHAILEEATRNNLQKAGLWQEGDLLLCQENKQDTKEIRRNEVIRGTGHCEGMGKRILLASIGDQLVDMEVYPPNVLPGDYKNYYRDSDKWGSQYFILPNPMYGYWARGYSP